MNRIYEIILPILTVGGFGLGFGIVLAYMAKRFAPEVNEVEEKLFSALPGANCGACGFAGCRGYARALGGGAAEVNKCLAGGSELMLELSKILGVDAKSMDLRLAAVHCQGGRNSYFRTAYSGIETCTAEQITAPGRCSCEWGCLGHGDCVKVCPFDAIHMGETGYPIVDRGKCTGCGKCVDACPRGIISLIPVSQKVYLGCRNPQKGKTVKESCSKGCIGCRLCSMPSITPSGKVAMKGNLPEIPADWEDFDKAVEKCPGRCFVVLS